MNVTDMTLNRLIEEFYQLTSKHKFIKTSFYGDFLNTVESEKVQHLSFLFNAVVGNISEKFVTFNFTIAVMDKVFKDQSNRVDVESDSVQILSDIFSVITKSDRWLSFSRLQGATAPIQKFIGKGEDQVTGWSMTMQLGIMRTSGLCDLPIEGYDYEGAYTAFCAGVRIFQDGILVDVVPSGGRYDYSTGGGSIDIDVNGFAFYVGVSTNQNVEVVGTDDLPKGSVIAGPKLRIADSPITFNTAPVEPIPSELSKAVVVQTVDANPTGDIIEDTPTSLKIEIQNSQVNVNGDGFESIPPDSVLNIPVVDTTDVAVGTNTGTKIVVASSLIDVNGVPLIPVRSQQAKSVVLIDAIDFDPVSVIIATNTEALAEIILPNGSVVNKDSAGATLYTTPVKSGGTTNRVINDGSITFENAQGDDIQTYTNKAEEAKVVVLPIIYLRPKPSLSSVSSIDGDDYWYKLNNPDTYVPAVVGIPALLDPSTPHKLRYKNAFGHLWRRTGINGGYYDIDTAEYKLADGTVSTQAVTFGSGADAYFIDHHTGLGWRWSLVGGGTTHAANFATAEAATYAGFDDWMICSIEEHMSLYVSLPNFNFQFPQDPNYYPMIWNSSFRFRSNNPSLPATSMRSYTVGNYSTSTTSVNNAWLPVRRHYT